MTLEPRKLARAADALVGTPFRLNGRDPASGIDCIGLFEAALCSCGTPVRLPNGYRLRLTGLEGWLPEPAALGFCRAQPPFEPGDVVMQWVGPGQFHLAIAAAECGWVHAHAGLRRVVRTSDLPDGAIVHHWRPAPTT